MPWHEAINKRLQVGAFKVLFLAAQNETTHFSALFDEHVGQLRC
jgi:hypothetical protein